MNFQNFRQNVSENFIKNSSVFGDELLFVAILIGRYTLVRCAVERQKAEELTLFHVRKSADYLTAQHAVDQKLHAQSSKFQNENAKYY